MHESLLEEDCLAPALQQPEWVGWRPAGKEDISTNERSRRHFPAATKMRKVASIAREAFQRQNVKEDEP